MKLLLPIIRVVLWVFAALALTIVRLHPSIHHVLLVISSGITADRVRAEIAPWGPWAALASILIMVVLTVLPIPADPLILANGAVFGVWEGLLVSIVGALLSGCVAFGLGRIIGRRAALRIVPASVVDRVEEAAAGGAWLAVLTVQLLPAIPFSVLNFLLGLTKLPWSTFLWTLAASILPADAILVTIGRGVAEGHSAIYWTLAAFAFLVVASVSGRRWFARAWRPQLPQALSLRPSSPATHVN